jgi:hypothetical protein
MILLRTLCQLFCFKNFLIDNAKINHLVAQVVMNFKAKMINFKAGYLL